MGASLSQNSSNFAKKSSSSDLEAALVNDSEKSVQQSSKVLKGSETERDIERSTSPEFEISIVERAIEENRKQIGSIRIDNRDSLVSDSLSENFQITESDIQTRLTSGSDSNDSRINTHGNPNLIQSSLSCEIDEDTGYGNLVNARKNPQQKTLFESEDYREVLKIREHILSPREFSKLNNEKYITRINVSRSNLLVEEEMKEDFHDSLINIRPSDEVGCDSIKKGSYESLTDSSDDENGFPKCDLNQLLEDETERTGTFSTTAEYLKDRNTSGQIVQMRYPIDQKVMMKDGTVRLECLGPDGTRIQDFLIHCINENVSLISMFGKFYENRGVNCKRYIPDDDNDVFECGDMTVVRIVNSEKPFDHCRIQKLAIRNTTFPKNLWYEIWHCERALQEDFRKDHSKEDEEFNQLKNQLLDDMKTRVWLQHGPMKFSSLRDPIVEKNNHLKEFGLELDELVTQPVTSMKRRNLFRRLFPSRAASKMGNFNSAAKQSTKTRIACGADLTDHQFRHFENIDHNKEEVDLTEDSDLDSSRTNSILSIDEIAEDKNSYPVLTENRHCGHILYRADGPREKEIEDFWRMIISKQIPTIHMTCDLEEGKLKNCGQYFPLDGEGEKTCGIYSIKRLGTTTTLSANLKRQQLLIHENNGSALEYKHIVTHFHESIKECVDTNPSIKNSEIINQHVSHQPNPQLLVHGEWLSQKEN